MDNQFEGLDVNEINPENTYYCSEFSQSTGFILTIEEINKKILEND